MQLTPKLVYTLLILFVSRGNAQQVNAGLEERKYLVGVLPFRELAEKTWWRENNNSLILTPEPVIEDVEIRKLKKKSLELAGLFEWNN